MNRRIDDLVPALQEKYNLLKKSAEEKGINFFVTATRRTEAEQAALYAQGRKEIEMVNRLRKKANLAPIQEGQNIIVTWTKNSLHLAGEAFDVCISGTNPAAIEVHPDYFRLGELAETIGLKWGGRFKKPDYPHFQL